ncbi:MAG: glycosyltransferase family 4 protein [Patescibacteria group bacterium]
MKRAAVFSPTWDSLGGGERYASAVANLLLDAGYAVDIWWPKNLSSQIKSRFGIDVSRANFVPFPDNYQLSTINYQLVFWASDGSLPISLAKKTLIHYQIPFKNPGFLNKIKARFYPSVCNSFYTKEVIDKTYGINSQVVYPPVDVDSFTPQTKTNTIVSIARFSTLLHAKRQDTLIEAFSRLYHQLPGWELILAGGSTDPKYVSQLKKQVKDSPVKIITNPTLSQIRQLLCQAKIFWSATGFGVDVSRHPEKAEHFGITVVEAMSAGTIPVVTNAGGHRETVIDHQTGLLWTNLDQLIDNTLKLAHDPKLVQTLSKNAKDRSKLFSTAVFNRELTKLL